MIYIYKIINKINGKIYIGQTFDPKERWKGHCKCKGKINHPLYNSMKHYGVENFIFKIIDKCDSQQEADLQEIYLIKEHCSTDRNFGYNLSFGGFGNCGGLSEETKRKISEATKKGMTDEVRKKISVTSKNRIVSSETRKKMSESAKNISEETRIKLSKACKGKKLSNEHKQKLSESKKGKKNPCYGKKHSDETKKRMSESHKGKLKSEETKIKMKEARKNVLFLKILEKKW